jgi:hypothetical protein
MISEGQSPNNRRGHAIRCAEGLALSGAQYPTSPFSLACGLGRRGAPRAAHRARSERDDVATGFARDPPCDGRSGNSRTRD